MMDGHEIMLWTILMSGTKNQWGQDPRERWAAVEEGLRWRSHGSGPQWVLSPVALPPFIGSLNRYHITVPLVATKAYLGLDKAYRRMYRRM